MDKETKTILGDFNLSADRLANHFCKKHDWPQLGEYTEWAADERGGILAVAGMYYIGLSEILTDLRLDAPVGTFEKWYEAYREMRTDDTPDVNYLSYLRGYGRKEKH